MGPTRPLSVLTIKDTFEHHSSTAGDSQVSLLQDARAARRISHQARSALQPHSVTRENISGGFAKQRKRCPNSGGEQPGLSEKGDVI